MDKNVSTMEMGVLISLVLLLAIGAFLSFTQPGNVLLEMLLIVLISVQLVSLALKVRELEKKGNV